MDLDAIKESFPGHLLGNQADGGAEVRCDVRRAGWEARCVQKRPLPARRFQQRRC